MERLSKQPLGGCIAASPRLRVLALRCANAKTYNVNVRMSARYSLGISRSRALNHRNYTEGLILSTFTRKTFSLSAFDVAVVRSSHRSAASSSS